MWIGGYSKMGEVEEVIVMLLLWHAEVAKT